MSRWASCCHGSGGPPRPYRRHSRGSTAVLIGLDRPLTGALPGCQNPTDGVAGLPPPIRASSPRTYGRGVGHSGVVWYHRPALLGCGQAVRRLTLDQEIEGSNPSAPAIPSADEVPT